MEAVARSKEKEKEEGKEFISIRFSHEDYYEKLRGILELLPRGERHKVLSYFLLEMDRISSGGEDYFFIINKATDTLAIIKDRAVLEVWNATVRSVRNALERKYKRRFFSVSTPTDVIFVDEDALKMPVFNLRHFDYWNTAKTKVDGEEVTIHEYRDPLGDLRADVSVYHLAVIFHKKLEKKYSKQSRRA